MSKNLELTCSVDEIHQAIENTIKSPFYIREVQNLRCDLMKTYISAVIWGPQKAMEEL